MLKLKIMLVDDNEDILELLTAFLDGYGFETYAFSSAKEALEAYVTSDDVFDLVISDMQMPEIDGISFLLKIQQHKPPHKPLHKPKLVIITGGVTLDRHNDQTEKNDLIDGLIYKRFRSKDVLSVIKSIFN
jgi:CheY-like chemotaxis protein